MHHAETMQLALNCNELCRAVDRHGVDIESMQTISIYVQSGVVRDPALARFQAFLLTFSEGRVALCLQPVCSADEGEADQYFRVSRLSAEGLSIWRRLPDCSRCWCARAGARVLGLCLVYLLLRLDPPGIKGHRRLLDGPFSFQLLR